MTAIVPKMNSLQLRDALARIAESQIGVREVGGNNRGPQIVKYQKVTWLAPGPWPWCAAFVDWVIFEWLKAPAVLRALGLTAAQAEKWRPQTAAAFGLEDWAREHGMKVLDETAAVRRGDLFTLDVSHIGIVRADAPKGARFKTIEGNTEPKGSREGGGVYSLERGPRSIVRKIIRIVEE
jgi:hypothetical protein